MRHCSAVHLLLNSCPGLALSPCHCSSLLAGTLPPCFDLDWLSSASFLLWWQNLSSPCKHHAAPCILSCCFFSLKFTPLKDLIATIELHESVLQAAQN